MFVSAVIVSLAYHQNAGPKGSVVASPIFEKPAQDSGGMFVACIERQELVPIFLPQDELVGTLRLIMQENASVEYGGIICCFRPPSKGVQFDLLPLFLDPSCRCAERNDLDVVN